MTEEYWKNRMKEESHNSCSNGCDEYTKICGLDVQGYIKS